MYMYYNMLAQRWYRLIYQQIHVLRGSHTCGMLSTKHIDKCPQEIEGVLYVHWPYCTKRCSYCNFNKYISNNIDHSRMRSCLVQETKTLLQLSGINKLSSIFFGGGTPSLAQPITIRDVIQTATENTSCHGNLEVSMEVNPTTKETAKLVDFKEAGVNRFSIGVQSLNPADLVMLDRVHTVEQSLRCIEESCRLLPERVSVDLMFGLPGQTCQQWQNQLYEILQICDNHISLYQLTVERGTQLFKDVTSGRLKLPDSEELANMYQTTIDILEDAGFERYEASNFARKGARCIHNQSYWRGIEYIGVGPGAHGRFIPRLTGGQHRQARIQTLEPIPWMREVEQYCHGTRKEVNQEVLDILQEFLVLGLRTKDGISNEKWEFLSCGTHLLKMFNNQDTAHYVDAGLLQISEDSLKATPKGLTVIDSITPTLLNSLETYITAYGRQEHQKDCGEI